MLYLFAMLSQMKPCPIPGKKHLPNNRRSRGIHRFRPEGGANLCSPAKEPQSESAYQIIHSYKRDHKLETQKNKRLISVIKRP